MKQLILLLCITGLFSCQKELSIKHAQNVQKPLGICGTKDLPNYMDNSRGIPSFIGINTSSIVEVVLVKFDGFSYPGGDWGPAYNFQAWDGTDTASVLNIVREKYKSFNAKVTSNVNEWANAPLGHRTMCVMTINASDYLGVHGGIAIMNSAQAGIDEPCFVEWDYMAGSVFYAGIAAGHELGHTFGLLHQALWTTSPCQIQGDGYNYGSGDMSTGWAPMMGVAYYTGLSGWNNGPTSTANSQSCYANQDEYAVLNQTMSYNRDGDPNTIGRSMYRLLNKGSTLSGVIEQSGDVDIVKLPAYKSSPIPVVTCTSFGTLDIRLDLYTASGTLKGSIDPSNNPDIPPTMLNMANFSGGYIMVRPTNKNINVPASAMTGSWAISLK